MKTIKYIIATLIIAIVPFIATAETVTVGGLRYNLNTDGTASVAEQDRSIAGDIVIPSSIEYNDNTYSVNELVDYAFYSSNISSIVISEGITTIGEGCFETCWNLSSIKLPQSLATIKRYCFDDSSLQSIHIPKGVTFIGAYCLRKCDFLNSITVDPENVIYDSRNNSNAIIETTSNKMIAGCLNTTIPATVTELEACFGGVRFLTGSIEIPDGIVKLGFYCFEWSNIKQITLPQSLTTIESGCFSDCYELSTIICKSTVPPVLIDAQSIFVGSYPPAIKLYVPEAAVETYKSTSVWQDFDIKPIEVDGVDDLNVVNNNDNVKYLKDGNVTIKHNGQFYNINGQLVK